MVAVPVVGVTRPTSERRVVVLPDPLGPEEADHLPLVDVEAQVVDGPHGAEVLGQVLNRDDGHVTSIIRIPRPRYERAGRCRMVNEEEPSPVPVT